MRCTYPDWESLVEHDRKSGTPVCVGLCNHAPYLTPNQKRMQGVPNQDPGIQSGCKSHLLSTSQSLGVRYFCIVPWRKWWLDIRTFAFSQWNYLIPYDRDGALQALFVTKTLAITSLSPVASRTDLTNGERVQDFPRCAGLPHQHGSV